MPSSIVIRNPKYYREFDDSDNECCWQVESVGEDIKTILSTLGIKDEPMYEDWGAAFAWTNGDGIEHSMMITCVDLVTAAYEIEYFACRRRWVILRSAVPDSGSDFAAVIPKLRALDAGSRE